ncbi:MAG: hypothetical protein WC454_08210 [Phycisphaerae bacterium]|jgi:hypothetical protein
MNGLLNKPNTPLRLAGSYVRWSAAIVLMYLMARFIFPRNIGKLDFVGVTVGAVIGTLWSFTALVRAFWGAKKGIFVENQNRSRQWRFIWIVIEVLIPFTLGYCVLLLAKANKINFNFYDAVWSLIYFVFFAFFFVSGNGYYFLEWHFGKKFYDKLDI